MTDNTNGYKYILAYGMAIAIYILVIKTKLGYNMMYYAFALALMVLLFSQSKFIADSLAPLSADLLNKPNSQ